jgi:septal ring factor EnvC (AmiA/AmiB activator)
LEVGEARVKKMTRDQQALERVMRKLEQAERAQEQAEAEARQRQVEAAAEAKSRETEEARRAAEEAERRLAAQKLREKEAEEKQSSVGTREARDDNQADRGDEKSARSAEKNKAAPADSGEIPVHGHKLRGYGDPTGVGELRSRGVFFAAAEGARVRVLADGKVVFADWVRGYGNLIIVQHAGGYLSLYAQNEALLKSVGVHVKRGDVLATAGSSGGERKTGVYIEVRRGGQPMNPTRWSAWPRG